MPKNIKNPDGRQLRRAGKKSAGLTPRRAGKKSAGLTPLDRRRLLGVFRVMRRVIRLLEKCERALLLAETNLASCSPGLRRRSPGIGALQKQLRSLRENQLASAQLELFIVDSMPASIREGLI